MGFRLNIAFSLGVHALLIAAVCALGFGGAAFPLPEPHMLIALVEGLSDGPHAPEKPGERNRRNILMPVKKSLSYSGDSGHDDLPSSRQEAKFEQHPSALKPDMPSSGLIDSDLKGTVTGNNIAASGQAQDSGIGIALSSGSASTLQGKGVSDANGHHAARQIDANKGEASSDMYRLIRTAIAKVLVYPALAKKRGIEGTVITEFTINSSGYPENIKIAGSSGYDILDTAARDTVLRASPFNAARVWIEIPIDFRIKKK
jgi:TonB family protein